MSELAVIYVRVSRDNQTEESQQQPCLAFCEKKEWTVIGVYADHAKSAYKNIVRPQYNQVMELVRCRKVQHVVVWSLDRWTRRGNKELRSTIDYLNKYGVQLHSVKEQWIEQLTTPELSFVRDIVLDVLGWVARKESERISNRVKNYSFSKSQTARKSR